MKKLLILVSLCAALAVPAAPGDYLTLNASGTTSAQVIFPADVGPARVVAYDVTADNATNRLFFYPTTTRYTVAATTVANTTNITFRGYNTIASNDVIVFQNAAGVLTNKIAQTNLYTTNRLITLTRMLGTNLAAGDTFSERLPTVYRPLSTYAANATTLHLASTAALDTNDVILLDRGSGAALTKATVATVVPNTNASITLNSLIPTEVAAATTVYRELYGTNISLRYNQDAEETVIVVTATNGMMAGTNLLIETAGGRREIREIDSISATNVTLTAGLGFAVTTNDWVRTLGISTTTVVPAIRGADSLIITASTGLSNAHTVIVGTTPPFRSRIAAAPVAKPMPTITIAAAFGFVAQPVHAIYKLTNTFTLAYPATRDDTSVIADVSTGLATGDTIIISPASTGVFANQIAPTPIINDITSTVRFPSAVGIALTAGDRAWLRGTGTHTLIGNATVRQQGEALYGVGAGKPLLISITGQAACSLNAITLKYD